VTEHKGRWEINIVFQHPLALVKDIICRGISELQFPVVLADRSCDVTIFFINLTPVKYLHLTMSLSGRCSTVMLSSSSLLVPFIAEQRTRSRKSNSE
jgi:hypothetical protein